jgi:RND family efflux transporter MFP subunit
LISSFGCGKKDDSGKGNFERGGRSKHVVKRGSITVKLEETGEILPIKEIDVKSQVSGKIIKLYIEEGDYVNKGDLIADIEPDYNQAERIANVKSNLKLNEIRLRNARKDYEDKVKLAEYISENELSDSEDRLIEAKLNYNNAVAQYELIKEIETEGSISKMRASASGTVIKKPVEEGEIVVAGSGAYSAGTVIVTLADLERMVVSASINEVDISKIKKGQAVSIKLDAFPYEKFSGKISYIAAMAINNNNVKVFPIKVEIDNVDSKIRPGMTANITIIGEDKKDIVVVPIRAIFSDENGQDIVYRVQRDTLITAKMVKTGINNFQEVEIMEGISVGDTISLIEKKTNISKRNSKKH